MTDDRFQPRSSVPLRHPEWSRAPTHCQFTHATPALWNAPWGASMVRIPAEAPALAFVRRHDAGEHAGSAAVAVFNWSDTAPPVAPGDGPFAGTYTDVFSGETADLVTGTSVDVGAWGWRMVVRHGPGGPARTRPDRPANR